MGMPLTHHPLACGQERPTPLREDLHSVVNRPFLLPTGRKVACHVSVFPCSFCRQRKPGKLASAYWAWFLADGERSAWKARYCPACAESNLSALFSQLREMDGTSDVFACVSCGTNAAEDSDPIYLTLYLPGKEPQEIALQLDSACAAGLRIPVTSHAERLPDRGGVVRGPSPLTSAWDALGLAPVS
jgi:hypothetical protein